MSNTITMPNSFCMKTCKVIIIILLAMSAQMMLGQRYDLFLDEYHHNKNFVNQPARNANEYQNIEGNPYLNSEFIDGVIYFKDTTAVKLLLRYNIYADEMEYRLNGVNYIVGNPGILKKTVLGESVFIYLPFIEKGGYFELLASGKCILVQKRSVMFKPAEGPKPIVGTNSPAQFIAEPDIFYLVVNESQIIEVKNMKSVINALQDQKVTVESYIEKEKIKKTKKENLIQIVEYYNSL
jgi:hypothetical protein